MIELKKDIRLEVDNYVGDFKFKLKNGQFRKFGRIGNAEVSLHVAEMLTKIGHIVEIVDYSSEEE